VQHGKLRELHGIEISCFVMAALREVIEAGQRSRKINGTLVTHHEKLSRITKECFVAFSANRWR
jgi:hypothetical protein